MTERNRERLDIALFAAGAVIIVAALAVGIFAFIKHQQQPKLANAQPACTLLTLADVRSVSGLSDATQQSTADNTAALTKTKDVQQTACAYKTDGTTVNIMSIQAFSAKGRTALTSTVNNFAQGANGLTSADATAKVTNFGKGVTAYYNGQLHYLILRKGNFVVEMATITGDGDTTAAANNPETDQTDVLALAKIVLPKISPVAH